MSGNDDTFLVLNNILFDKHLNLYHETEDLGLTNSQGPQERVRYIIKYIHYNLTFWIVVRKGETANLLYVLPVFQPVSSNKISFYHGQSLCNSFIYCFGRFIKIING